jgi:16S rRNA (uracil1498-N3)-methyltransferase
MHRFYYPAERIAGDKIHIRGPQAHHISNVLRLKEKDKLTVFDGKGNEYLCFISRVFSGKDIVIRIKDKLDRPVLRQKIDFSLAVSLPRGPRMDWIVQKCTELGAGAIIPMQTCRGVVKVSPPRQDKRLIRWRKIAIEASRQARRGLLPEIYEILKFEDVVSKAGEYDLNLLLTVAYDTVPIKKPLREFIPEAKPAFQPVKILALIGPEGDFSKEEMDLARQEGFKIVSLGNNVLRVDTAAITVASILNYENL